jgi:hypothetical protein
MKKHTITLLSTLLLATPLCFAQGSLTPPPGAPGPVMKSLDQIEARTPLVAGATGVSVNGTTGTITINASGSYYLTKNLVISSAANGIHVVGAVDVTIDLNGFTIIGTVGNSTTFGILPDGHADGQFVKVRNGFIRGTTTTGFAYGIGDDGSAPYPHVAIERVHCSNIRNGIDFGIGTSSISTVDHCAVFNCGGSGIEADTVRNCSVQTTVGFGIRAWSLVSDSRVLGAGGIGIQAQGQGCSVVNCYASASATGILAPTVVNSYGNGGGTGSFGIDATTVQTCRGRHSSGGSNVAIRATIGVASTAEFGVLSITNKYNMP